MDIQEVVRLIRLGQSDRNIARLMEMNRKTVGKYHTWAEAQGFLKGPLPSLAELQQRLDETWPQKQPRQSISTVEPYREQVVKLRQQGVEAAAIHQRLVEEHGFQGSYPAVWRFVRKLEPKTPESVVRVEVKPGEEAQVDYGYAGKMVDPSSGTVRRSWLFVMTLSYSRHQYVEFVFDQKVETWLLLHRHAFEYFGGVPSRIVPDNLKAAIVRACWEDPVVQRAYRECALHYGFLIAPCRPGTPEHKGKVEQGGVHYVKRNFLAGRQAPLRLDEANRKVQEWIERVAGQRRHGTTRQQPLHQFQDVERETLLPLAVAPYEPAVWKQATLHRDCYVVFEQAYYSAPHRLVGQRLWVRGGAGQVHLYDANHQLVASHSRATAPGQRQTHLDHLPAEKVPGLVLNRESCRQEAVAIGPATAEVVETLLVHRPEDRLRSAGRLLRLQERVGRVRLEAACRRALHYGEANYVTVKRILEQGLDAQPLPAAPESPPARTFLRSAHEFARNLVGGGSWN